MAAARTADEPKAKGFGPDRQDMMERSGTTCVHTSGDIETAPKRQPHRRRWLHYYSIIRSLPILKHTLTGSGNWLQNNSVTRHLNFNLSAYWIPNAWLSLRKRFRRQTLLFYFTYYVVLWGQRSSFKVQVVSFSVCSFPFLFYFYWRYIIRSVARKPKRSSYSNSIITVIESYHIRWIIDHHHDYYSSNAVIYLSARPFSAGSKPSSRWDRQSFLTNIGCLLVWSTGYRVDCGLFLMRHRMCLRQSDTVYSTAAEVVNNNCTSSDLEIRCRIRNARNRLQTSLNIELRQQLICKRRILNVSLKDILCLSLPVSVGLFISVILLNLFFHNRLHPCIPSIPSIIV